MQNPTTPAPAVPANQEAIASIRGALEDLIAEMNKLSALKALFEAAAENDGIILSPASARGVQKILESAISEICEYVG
jgi:hypothetical protein